MLFFLLGTSIFQAKAFSQCPALPSPSPATATWKHGGCKT